MSLQKRNAELVELLRADFIDHATGVIKDTLRAKGDIFVATARATIIRLPVGNNDEVIVANSSAADGSGVEWAALGGAGVPVSHPGLTNLSWTTAGHIATVNSSIAAFNSSGVAVELTDTLDGQFVVGTGAGWTVESGNTARTSLGLGTGDSPTFAGLTVNGNIQIANTKYIDFLQADTSSDGTGFYRSAADDLVLDITTAADEFIIQLGGADALVLSDGSSTNTVLSFEGTYTHASGEIIRGMSFAPRLESAEVSAILYALDVSPTYDYTGAIGSAFIGINVTPTAADGAAVATDMYGIFIQNIVGAASIHDLGTIYGLYVDGHANDGGTAPDNSHGIYVDSQTIGTSANYAFYTNQDNAPTGAYAFYATGDANSRFNGDVQIANAFHLNLLTSGGSSDDTGLSRESGGVMNIDHAGTSVVEIDSGANKLFRIPSTAETTGNVGVHIEPALVTSTSGGAVLLVNGEFRPGAAFAAAYGAFFSNALDTTAFDVTAYSGVYVRTDTRAGYSGALTTAYGVQIANPTFSGSNAVTNYGLYVQDLTSGSSNNRAIASVVADAAGAYNLYISGTAPNYLLGDTGIGGAPSGSYNLEVTGTSYFSSTTDVAGDFDVGNGVLFVNVAGTRVGINMVPDAQFDLDILGNLRVGGWIVGKHAIQLNEAFHIWHFDNPVTKTEAATNYNVVLTSHKGKTFDVIEGGTIGRVGKFGQALSAGRSTSNKVDNPRFETPANTNATTGWTNSALTTMTSGAVEDPVIGQFALYTLAPASPTTAYAEHALTVAAGDYAVSTYVTASVYVRTSDSGWKLRLIDTGFSTTDADISDTGEEWVRYSVTVLANAASTGMTIRLYNDGVAGSDEAWWQGVQFERQQYAENYIDGWMGGYNTSSELDGDGHYWTGTAGNSVSWRRVSKLRYPITMPTTTWTVMFWAYIPDGESTDDAGGTNHAMYMGGTWYNSGSDRIIFCYRNPGVAAGSYYHGYLARGGSGQNLGTMVGLSPGWHHFAYVYDEDADTIVSYLDADEDTATSYSLPGTGFGTVPDSLYVGSSNSYGSHGNSLIDDFAITHDALTADEIRAVYESDAPVFAESSTFQFAAGPYQLVWADEHGLWVRNSAVDGGTAVFGVYGGDATRSWGGYTMNPGDVLIGKSTNGVLWDDDGASGAGQLIIGDTGTNARVEIDATNGLIIYNGDNDATFTAAPTGDVEITNVLEIGTNGGIWQGTGTFAAPTTGLKIHNVSGVATIETFSSSTSMLTIDDEGIALEADVSYAPATGRSIDWFSSSNRVATISSEATASGGSTFKRIKLNTYLVGASTTEGSSLSIWDDSVGVGGGISLSSTAHINLIVAGTDSHVSFVQGAGEDTPVVSFTNNDVLHGITDLISTVTSYAIMGKSDANGGGLQIQGIRDSGGAAGLALDLRGALDEAADTTLSTSGIGVVHIEGAVADAGTGLDPVADAGNLLSIANDGSTVFLMNGDGQIRTFSTGARSIQIHKTGVAHTFTDHTETDVVGSLGYWQSGSGGLNVHGWKDGTEQNYGALILNGALAEAPDETTTSSGHGVIRLMAAMKTSGTAKTSLGSADNLFSIENNGTSVAIWHGDGTLHVAAAAHTNNQGDYDASSMDSYDDAALIRTLERQSPMGIIDSQWDEYIMYNKDTLIEAGILAPDGEDGAPGLMNLSRLQRLQHGAIWQNHSRVRDLEQKVEYLERKVRLLTA